MHRELLARERFASVWQEMAALVREHFVEVDGGVQDTRRPCAIDTRVLGQMDAIGTFQVYTARSSDGILLGYCTWNLGYDLESQGLAIAHQGGWYSPPGRGRMAFRLYKFCLRELAKQGIKLVFPHHRLAGRATVRLGDWFERLGAVPEQITYRLWLEDVKHA